MLLVNLLCLIIIHEISHIIALKVLWNIDIYAFAIIDWLYEFIPHNILGIVILPYTNYYPSATNIIAFGVIPDRMWPTTDIIGCTIMLLIAPITAQLIYARHKKINFVYMLLFFYVTHQVDFQMLLSIIGIN